MGGFFKSGPFLNSNSLCMPGILLFKNLSFFSSGGGGVDDESIHDRLLCMAMQTMIRSIK